MTKYKEYYDRMTSENKAVFDDFAKLHANYGMDNDKFQNNLTPKEQIF